MDKSLPEWLEYWIARTDSSYYVMSVIFMSIVGRIISGIKSRREKWKALKEAEIKFFRRN